MKKDIDGDPQREKDINVDPQQKKDVDVESHKKDAHVGLQKKDIHPYKKNNVDQKKKDVDEHTKKIMVTLSWKLILLLRKEQRKGSLFQRLILSCDVTLCCDDSPVIPISVMHRLIN